MTAGPGLTRARMLITGASAGIGRALAVGAVGQGAQVKLVARRKKELEAAPAEAGGQAFAVDYPGIAVEHLPMKSPSARVASFMETFAGLAEAAPTDQGEIND